MQTLVLLKYTTGCIKKVDYFETALNLAKRLEVWSFLLIYIAWVPTVYNKWKYSEI